ncbi:MAG: hypothetical protein PHF51_03190 [Candidatus ainarchaeum sp.]|nr:hypothetical protein [Candidatus ainarchaeum sp.]
MSQIRLVALALAATLLFGCIGLGQKTEKPAIDYFVSSPPAVRAGETATLSWSVSGAATVTLDGMPVSLSGTSAVMPSETKTYLLTAANAAGTSQASVQVMILPATPTPGETATPAPAATATPTPTPTPAPSATPVPTPTPLPTPAPTPPATCGNAVCDSGETNSSCCMDCGCASGFACEDGNCAAIPENASTEDLPLDVLGRLGMDIRPRPVCGDGICILGENSSTCCADCGCASGLSCFNKTTCIINFSTRFQYAFTRVMLPIFSGTAYGYDEAQDAFTGIVARKSGTALTLTLKFRDLSARESHVLSEAGPKIYFDDNNDGVSDYVATILGGGAYVWSRASGGNVYSGPTSCNASECSISFPWSTVFGAADSVRLWASHPDGHRIPSVSALELNWTSFSFVKAHASEPYIVAVLESVTVHNDGDDVGPGEVMFSLDARSGSVHRFTDYPMHNWYVLDDGDMILGGDENAVPIFAARESEMGDTLTLTMAARDNDDGVWPFGTGSDLLGALEKTFGRSTGFGVSGTDTGSSTELGVSGTTYEEQAGGVTYTYSVKRVYLPPGLNAEAKLYGIKILSSADSNTWCCEAFGNGGEFYTRMRVAAGYSGSALASTRASCPESGEVCVCNGWVKCPTYARELFGTRPQSLTIYNGAVSAPFLFLELGGWDADAPSVGDNDDSLGIVTKTWLLDETFFDWEPEMNKPKEKAIDFRETYSGVQGGRMETDIGVRIWPG